MGDEMREEAPKGPGSGNDQVEKAPDEGGEKKEEVRVDFAAELAKSRQEIEELRGAVKVSMKKASDAEAFSSSLTQRLQEAASNASAREQERIDPNDVRERLRERINEDPLTVLDEHYQARTQPLVQGFLEQQGKMNRELFVARMGGTEEGKEVLKEYMPDVDEFLKDFEPQHRASPDAYDAALRWVMAKPDNLEKELARREKKRREKEQAHFVEPATAGERGPREQKRELSSIEKEVAKGLGISDEEYSKYKEA